MLIIDIIRSAFKALFAKRIRTLLTMVGVIVGVGSVIVMLAYGEGQKRELLARFEGISDKSMYITFWYRARDEVPAVPRSFRLTEADAEAITAECSAVKFAIPEAMAHLDVTRESATYPARISVADQRIFEIYSTGLADGRLFTEDDNLNRSRVCVVGADVQEQLFPEMSAVDQFINIFERRFRIVGVLRPAGNRRSDSAVYVPWLTGRERTSAVPQPTNLRAQAVSSRHLVMAQRQVRELVQLRYPSLPVPDDIYDEEQSPVRIRTVATWKEEREQTADSFSMLLLVIGALSLVIGGVGVMNIMLVSIHERTPEIGLRKALGARRRDILAQFLVESVIICMLGGAMGIMLAFLACRYLERLPAEASIPDPVITTWAMLVAVAVTLGTGLFFGVYPAVRAAQLSPIEALHTGG